MKVKTYTLRFVKVKISGIGVVVTCEPSKLLSPVRIRYTAPVISKGVEQWYLQEFTFLALWSWDNREYILTQ